MTIQQIIDEASALRRRFDRDARHGYAYALEIMKHADSAYHLARGLDDCHPDDAPETEANARKAFEIARNLAGAA